MDNMKLDQIKHIGPICALKVISNNLLLSGEGPTLSLYDYIKGEKIFERLVFKRNKIHGIEIINSSNDIEDDIKIVIWGGRSLSIFTLNNFKDLNYEIPHYGVSDWIFHCLFENESTLHVLNSHNIVHTVSLLNDNCKLINTKHCGWKSILYSGTISINKETGKITVLAGTVMNGILIWDFETCQVKHNLTEHEGSIFKVVASPDNKYIISCSDDRSIKVWDMETGELLANGWGHGSRIWGLNVYNISNDGFNIFSCSEDCTARVWRFNFHDNYNNGELIQERIILVHTGRHVWSLDLNDEKKLGFTAGADGKIFVSDLNESQRDGYWGHKWELNDISNEINCVFQKGELIKNYSDFGYGLIAVTSEGKIMILKDYKKWKLLFIDDKFAKFCILKIFENEPIVIIAGKMGDCILMKFNENCEIEIKHEFNLNDSFNRLGNILINGYDDNYFALFESPNPNDPLIYKKIDPINLSILESYELLKPKDKITISSLEYNKVSNMLFVGCRFATMLVYKIENENEKNQPLVVYKNLFKGDTVSSIKSLYDNSNNTMLYITNKDGTYHIMKINENSTYEYLQSSKIQKGFLEGHIKTPNGDILLYGFKSDCFFVWNETKQYEVYREICGGPHRRWNFKYWFDSNNRLRYRFVYTRSSEVQIVQQGEPYAFELLSDGLHGREIRDICVINSQNNNDEKIIITGAEDTTLKISTLKNDGTFNSHWTYREHIGGLQSIHAINDEYILSSSAKEELYLWKITECDNKKCMSLESSLPPSEENPDLRVMDFDSIEVYDKINGKKIGFLIVTVYSNSMIKVIYYDIASKKFKVLIDDNYMQCCIFHVRFVCIDKRLFVLIASTNGHLSIYDINNVIGKYFSIDDSNIKEVKLSLNDNKFEEINESTKLDKLIINQQIHQSSVKALDILQETNGCIKVITGGDDNSIIVSKITKDEGLKFDIESFLPSAASSTITTVTVIDEKTVLVGAVDQSIKLWNIENGLTLVDNKYTTVADTGCSEIASFKNGEKYLLIGGAGFSIWKITN
ncbi:Rtt10 protein [Pichia kluyveri]|uniref:Rtt10 protein n=1 Tax=Pichia kluyveri TaxID=36015 RepID=A0AAV5R1A4_PICKL|nr:Rtt10 protein [Pichia kluyveri]